MNTQPVSHPTETGIDVSHRKVIFASSLGTVFEWYDFYLYGALLSIISKTYFSGVNETTSYIFALLAFASGFFVRPFGALVFGRLGDLVGRKHTFLITIIIMGASTAGVGLLPGTETIGIAAPIILVGLRLLQGLALGGEYGGAATYVAEHAPYHKRGAYTSWIQTTATMGLFLSLLVILVCRLLFKDQFDAFGWRIPFLISIALLIVSVYIRLQLEESPVFLEIKREGQLSKAPLTEAFANWSNLKIVLLALFGATAGQAVVWYTGQFYVLTFLEKILQVESKATSEIVACALLLGTPFFLVFGSLSDRIGRKKIVMAGCLLAAIAYYPIFKGITHYANPALEHAAEIAPITVVADPDNCSFQFDPVGKKTFTTSCDVVGAVLAKSGVPYHKEVAPAGSIAKVRIGSGDSAVTVESFAGNLLPKAEFKVANEEFAKKLKAAIADAGYPLKADMGKLNWPMVILLCTLLIILVTMVYGPIAAWLVELFPPRIRYTSMSLPYHIGNGWFGGFLPFISFMIVVWTGNIYSGLIYPIGVAALSAIIGLLFLRETKDDHLKA